MIFSTPRLIIRIAVAADAPFYARLWNDPRVTQFVGFPHGIHITHDAICAMIAQQPDGVFGRLLVVTGKATGNPIGECKLYGPDAAGIARTDVKLLPEFWGHKYGVEVKRGLIAYLFAHTDCIAVEGTPNVANIASIKMQEAVGGVRVGEKTFVPSAAQRNFMLPVHSIIYRVYRPQS